MKVRDSRTVPIYHRLLSCEKVQHDPFLVRCLVESPRACCPFALSSASDNPLWRCQLRSYWIPGSWHVRMVYTDAIPFYDP